MNYVYIITSTDRYNQTSIERIYTSIEEVKQFLLTNYRYWNDKDINENDIKEITSLSDKALSSQDFYVSLECRAIDLEVQRIKVGGSIIIV